MSSFDDLNSRMDRGTDFNSANYNSDMNSRMDRGTDFNSASYNSGNTSTNTSANTKSAQEHAAGLFNAAKGNAAAAANNVQNSQFAQDLANGPAAQSVRQEAAATGNEFSDLANSRKMPEHTAANDTPLTHYHSFFYNLLSWRNPRATAISFVSILLLIFACRYLPIVRLALKGTWTILGIVTLAEAAAKFTIGSSVANSVRPRKYYKIPKEKLETALDDVEQLINFFVIEGQRIVFAENIPNTALAFIASFASYYLVKLLPAWGFGVFFSSVVFLVPLVYTQNKEMIDTQLENVSNITAQQTKQLRDLTAEHTSKGFETVKSYTGEYANVASEYIGKSRQKIPSMPATNGSNTSAVQDNDFPQAPKNEFVSSTERTKPVLSTMGDDERIAASY